MLSTSVIKNVSQASHYYSEQDNYYTKDQGISQSEWFGKGAEKLNLQGEVNLNTFTDLLKGRVPETREQLGKKIGKEIKHRAGWDLTFSAPKSVSILALHGGDARLLDAHRTAVKKVLTRVEKLAKVRVKSSDGMQFQSTHNVIASLFHHDVSRAKDPQLHTHAVIMNMTQRSDGKWRSMASQMGQYGEDAEGALHGFIERIRHDNRYFSKIYEAELASQIKAMGYDITTDTESGIFEIKGVPKEVIAHFSKRRKTIQETLSEKGWFGGKAAQMAALSTRMGKEVTSRDLLQTQWEEAAKGLGFDSAKIIAASQERLLVGKSEAVVERQAESELNFSKEATSLHLKEAIEHAAASLSFFQTTFSLEALVTASSDFMIQHDVSIDTVLALVDQYIKNGDLLSVKNQHGKSMLMRKSSLQQEKQLFACLEGTTLTKPWVKEKVIDRYLEANPEHLEHDADIHTIFSAERVVIVEGKAASYQLLKPILEINKKSWRDVVVLSPSILRSKQYAKNMKPEMNGLWNTIKSWFIDQKPKHYSVSQFLSRHTTDMLGKKPIMLLVSDAEKLSTEQLVRLSEWNRKTDSKMLLLSNKQLLNGYKAGVSLAECHDRGVPMITLAARVGSMEQQIQDGAINELFDKISRNLIEHEHVDDRHTAMAAHFANLKDRTSSWLVAHKKQSVEILNERTHAILSQKGVLKEERMISALIPVFIVSGKGQLAQSYLKNHVVRFNEAYASLKVARGEYCRVLRHSKISNRVLLQKADGAHVVWRPDHIAGMTAGKVEVFKEEMKPFAINETLVAKRSMPAKNVVKDEHYTVIGFKKDVMQLQNADGKKVVLNLNEMSHRHLDYGYAVTLHQIAMQDVDELIIDLPSNSMQTNQRHLFQALSQSNTAWIYTDNTRKLQKNVSERLGNRISLHETLSQAEAAKAAWNACYDSIKNALIKDKGFAEEKAITAAIDAIDYASRHLAEREAGFRSETLMAKSLQYAMGDVTADSIDAVIKEMQKEGKLIEGATHQGVFLTTAQALKTEKEILAWSIKDRERLQPIISDAKTISPQEMSTLRLEQREAIEAILTSYDRVIPIQGHAGTGKTTMMTTLATILKTNPLLEHQGHTLHCIAPTHKAVKELKDRGLHAETAAMFLKNMRQGTQQDFSKTLLVIDEASMIANHHMRDILQIAHESNFLKIIPTGDRKQNPAIEAGKPYEMMQDKLDTLLLKNIQRQKNPSLRKAAELLYENKIADSFQMLKNHIVEINKESANDPNDAALSEEELKSKYYEKCVRAVAKDYLREVQNGEDVKIIAPSHADRKAVNAAVRALLQQNGTLKDHEAQFEIFTSKDRTGVERSLSVNFKQGEVLRFTETSGHFKAGDYYSVDRVDVERNQLILVHQGSSKRHLFEVPRNKDRKNQSVEVFAKEPRMLQVGDQITWTRTNQRENMLSAEVAEVMDINQENVTIKTQDGTNRSFNARDPTFQHWDHAYAITAYGAQGGTYSTILAFIETSRVKLNNLKNYLVIITRPVHQLRIYTDSQRRLQGGVTQNKGDKISALEVVQGQVSKDNKQVQQTAVTPSNNVKLETDHMANTHREKGHKSRIRTQRVSQFSTKSTSQRRYDLQELKEKLNRDAAQIATHLLGEPKEKHAGYLKFGSNQGSLTVTVKGEKSGWFNDFSTNQGGRDMLRFIEVHGGLTRKDAIAFAKRWLGMGSEEGGNLAKSKGLPGTKSCALPASEMAARDSKSAEGFSAYEQKRIALANKIARESRPLTGTIAETYLKQWRGVALESLPKDIRFHADVYSHKNQKSLPALIAIARNLEGKVQAVETIFLDAKTCNKADVPLVKQTIGVKKGALVSLSHGKNDAPTLIAEGVVTGLSLVKALPNASVKVTLGKQLFASIDPKQLSKQVVFCLDNDGKSLSKDKLVFAAAARLAGEKEVRFMVPKGLDMPKQDYNDVLKMKGVAAILQDFQNAVSHQEFYKALQEISPVVTQQMVQLSKQMAQNSQQKNQVSIKVHHKSHQQLRQMKSSLQQNMNTKSSPTIGNNDHSI